MNNEFNTLSFTKYRNELFGLAAIWIVLFHVHAKVGFPHTNVVFKGISAILAVGNLGVDIFLLFSAVGLCFSMQKNSVGQFYLNRIKRVFIPFIIIAVIYFIWYDFVYAQDGFLQFFLNITTVNYWINPNYPTWYVAFILIAYLVFPGLYYLDRKTNTISTIVFIAASIAFEIIARQNDWWIYQNHERELSRIPVFFAGILLFSIIQTKKRVHWIIPVLAFVAGVGAFVGIHFIKLPAFLKRYVLAFIGLCIIIFYSWVRNRFQMKILACILGFCGLISLEIYILHSYVIRILSYLDVWSSLPRFLWYVLFLVITIPLAFLYSKGVNKLEDKLFPKKA